MIAQIRADPHLVQCIPAWQGRNRRRGQSIIYKCFRRASGVNHITLRRHSHMRQRQRNDLVIIGSLGANIGIVDQHNLTAIPHMPDAPKQPAIEIGDGDDLVAIRALQNGDKCFTLPDSLDILTKIAETLRFVMANDILIILLNDGSPRLLK